METVLSRVELQQHSPSKSTLLSTRDEQIVHAAWSLGYAPACTLQALLVPEVHQRSFRRYLRRLHLAGYLAQRSVLARTGTLWLYGRGKTGLAVGASRPWRPSLSQLEHTLAVGDALVALTRPGFAPGHVVTGWQGEAEIRAWSRPGEPYPDLRVAWQRQGRPGAWLVEVDRATESRGAWRPKLARYVDAQLRHRCPAEPILALTTSDARALGLAQLAAEVGVRMIATTIHHVGNSGDPWVYDSVLRSRRLLSG